MIKTAITTLRKNHSLDMQIAHDICKNILQGLFTDEEIKEFLILLSKKKETSQEIIGFTKAMRSAMIPIPLDKESLDMCGTGGSGKSRFNISTAASFVIAAADISVAKHGNYGSKQKNGSFDFLESLKIRYFHPALKRLGPIRQLIPERTIFNILGPLNNPSKNTYHVLSTIDMEIAKKLADAIHYLGMKKAIVSLSETGIDELSIRGDNHIFIVTKEGISKKIWNFDRSHLDKTDYKTGNSNHNARLFMDVIASGKPHPLIDHIAVNAGAGFLCTSVVQTIDEGIEYARTLLLSGKVQKKVEELQKFNS
jgi:anthranilate phosphoribosyltransferase